MRYFKLFGGKISPEEKTVLQQSPHWKQNKFHNLVPTDMGFGLKDLPTYLYRQWQTRAVRRPQNTWSIPAFDAEKFNPSAAKVKYIWYGHSALLLQVNGKNIFIDPMMGGDAAPIAPIPSQRFSAESLAILHQVPALDYVLISHDHYDHLDYDSIEILKNKTQKFLVALGVQRHLIQWGIDPKKIETFDWYESRTYSDLIFHFTPTRHFSGRGLFDRFQSLWGGWIIQTTDHRIYFSGDGGYGSHFKKIGDQYGPFDLTFIECGQYNDLWPDLHMFPEEAVQAAIDSQSQFTIPVHWGGFALAQHAWFEPPQRFTEEAKEKSILFQIPQIGRIYDLDKESKDSDWWKIDSQKPH